MKDKSFSQRREVIQRNRLVTELLENGWNVFLPVFDEGIDMVAHHANRNLFRLIQQKSRWSIDKKYIGRSIWMAFPIDDEWYLVPHDEMLKWPELSQYMASSSWREKGIYYAARPSPKIRNRMMKYRIGLAADAGTSISTSPKD